MRDSEKIKILVVDRADKNYKAIARLLENSGDFGFCVEFAAGYMAFLEMASLNEYDLLIVFDELDVKDGLALIEDASAKGYSMPKLLVIGPGKDFLDIEMRSVLAGASYCASVSEINTVHFERTVRLLAFSGRSENDSRARFEKISAEYARAAETVKYYESQLAELAGELGQKNNERILADLALKQSESLLQFVLDALPVGVWLTDRRGRIILENPAAKKIWSGTRYDNIGRASDYNNWVSSPAAAEKVFEIVETIVHGRAADGDIARMEFLGPNQKVISYSVIPIADQNGESIGSVVVSTDVTEQKKYEEALTQSEKKYRQLIELSQEGFWVVDENDKTTFVNQRMGEILGYSPDDITGKPPYGFMDESNAAIYFALIGKCKNGQKQREEIEFAGGGGRRIFASVSFSPIFDEADNYDGAFSLVTDLTETKMLERQVELTKKELLAKYSFQDIIGKSDCMLELFEVLKAASEINCNILIEGPSGTGKSLFARTIHVLSARNAAPFVVVNCGAIPETLLESELFGYMKGAFTDAKKDKPGKFLLAAGGTIFLDEIAEMPLALQVKILRVIEEKRYEPLGASNTVEADVRVIAATNKDLAVMVKNGSFREDLYYRLKVVNFKIPPLCVRRDDVKALTEYFVDNFNRKYLKKISGVSNDVRDFFAVYDFPGNVRELQNIIESAFVFCNEKVIRSEHLPQEYRLLIKEKIGSSDMRFDDVAYVQPLENITGYSEKAAILNAIKACDGSKIKACALLKIDRTTLWRKMKKYGIV